MNTHFVKPSENKCHAQSSNLSCSEEDNAIGYISQRGKKQMICCPK